MQKSPQKGQNNPISDNFFNKNRKKLSIYLQDLRFMSIFAPKMHLTARDTDVHLREYLACNYINF